MSGGVKVSEMVEERGKMFWSISQVDLLPPGGRVIFQFSPTLDSLFIHLCLPSDCITKLPSLLIFFSLSLSRFKEIGNDDNERWERERRA